MAAAAMSFSSVSVIGNALRLQGVPDLAVCRGFCPILVGDIPLMRRAIQGVLES